MMPVTLNDKTRLISIDVQDENKNNIYSLGSAQRAITPEMTKYFRSSNPSFSSKATVVKVKIEYISKIDITDYLARRGIFKGMFIIRLFTEEGGRMVELKDPIIDATIKGNLFYSYNVDRNMFTPNNYTFSVQDIIPNFELKIDNTIAIFEQSLNYQKDSIWSILAAFTAGQLSFNIGNSNLAGGLWVIKDIQL